MEPRLLLSTQDATAATGPPAVVPAPTILIQRWVTEAFIVAPWTAAAGDPGAPPPAPTGPPINPGPPNAATTTIPEADFGSADVLFDDMAGACPLPLAHTLEVNGDIDPLKEAVFYRIQVDPQTTSLAIQLQSRTARQPLPEGLALFDENGHKLMETMPGPGSLSITMHVPTWQPHGGHGRMRTLYLKIALVPGWQTPTTSNETEYADDGTSMAPTPTDPSLSTGFILIVKREPVASNTMPDDAPLPGDAAMPVPQTPSAAIVSGPAGHGAQPAPAGDDVSALSPVPMGAQMLTTARITTGPLPSRSAAPIGGILGGQGEPTPEVSPDDTLVVDLALDGLLPDADGHRGDAPSEDGPDTPDSAVVALRGPGGFPLFGSSLVADESHPDCPTGAELPAFTFAPRFAQGETAPGARTGGGCHPAGPAGSPSATAATTARRVSVAAGVSAAVAFTSGLTLPDFTDPTRGRKPTRLHPRFLRRPARV